MIDRRVCRVVFMGLCCSILGACSSNQSVPVSDARSATIINPPRSSRGNPPFYEVFGERYYVLQSSDGYRDSGVASWYGDKFHGKETSSGEVYNMFAHTAAHKTLPIPTWVEVTNRENGKTVIVKVNDRGPFVDNRIIDLSYAAAQDIDMVRAGTARVRVRTLGVSAGLTDRGTSLSTLESEAVRTESPAVSAGIARAAGGTYVPTTMSLPVSGELGDHRMFVQVGAYSDLRNAEQMISRLHENGFGNSFLVSEAGSQRDLHRVRIGPLDGVDDFDFIRDGLRLIGINGAQLVTNP